LKNHIVYIVSKVDKAVAFEWIVEAFLKEGETIQFILLNDKFETSLAQFLKSYQIPTFQIKLGTKKNYPFVWLKVYNLLKKIKPQVVHTHLFEASLLGLSAAKVAGVKNRIYTRHHSTYHHEYFPHAVRYDQWINSLATDIVAISLNVKNVLVQKEKVVESKIHLIEHGFKLEQFESVSEDRISQLREKHRIPKDKLIIATISRYIELKGVEYVIRAFKNVHKNHSKTHLLLANAGGGDEDVIKKELKQLPKDAFTEIRFEEDLFALYQLIDFYVHVPINGQIEAFGQTYIEALAAGVPSIFTLSGIANDFIEHESNALVVSPKSSIAIELAINRLMGDELLRNRLIENGKQAVKKFELSHMITKLRNLYTT
tara:strand:+ start:1444 stop:2559 length:1116 start_codon:yes stop_codon:yes gene_type:complete